MPFQKIICFDIDGVLIKSGSIETSHNPLTVKEYFQSVHPAVETFKKIINKNHPRIIICSGRSINFIRKVWFHLTGDETTPLSVFESGSMIFNGKKEIILNVNPKGLSLITNAEFINIMHQFSKSLGGNFEKKKSVITLNNPSNNSIDEFKTKVEDFLKRIIDTDSFKLLSISISSKHSIEILPKGISKAVGLREILNLLPKHQSYYFGDSENDIEPSKLVNTPFAVGNSTYAFKEFVKNQNGIILKEIELDGVNEGLKMIFNDHD